MENKYKFILACLILISLIVSAGAVAADDLDTIEEGEVSGDVDIAYSNPGVENGELNYDIPEDVQDVQYAGLFVDCYTAGSYNTIYGSEANVTVTSNGESEQIANERLVSTEGSADGTVYRINDHTTKCFADYYMTYNLTNMLQNARGKVTINVTTGAIDGYEYYNKIKLIGLVFAYNDGDNDKVSYWVNSGSSWIKGDTGDTSKSTFNIGTIDNKILNATLDNFALSSTDGLYNLNGEDLIESEEFDEGVYYFKYHKFNVLNEIVNGTNTLTYSAGAGGYSLRNVLSVLTLKQEYVPSASIKFGSEYNGACFAGTNNVLQLNLTNDGSSKTVYNVEFYVDGVKVSSAEIEVAAGEKDISYWTDDTIRPVTADTVNGVSTTKVNYTVMVMDKDSGNLLAESTLLPTVWYNGNLGKDLAYPAENITSFNNITVNGGVIIDTKSDSTYCNAASTGRTDVWTIDVPADAQFVNGFVYVAYNWDKTQGTIPVWTTTFNNAAITPVASYRDQSNMGTYGKYGYGLIVYDVSSLLVNGENTFALSKITNLTAVYPSTLVAFYNVTESDTLKTIYMYNGADLLSNANNFLGRIVASNSVLNVNTREDIIDAKLHVFAASAQTGEGNLIVNDETYINVWTGTANSVTDYIVDLTDSVDDSNYVSFVATGSTIVALEQFIVVESVAYTDIYVSPDGTGTGASADDPTTIEKALNTSTLQPFTRIHVLDGTYTLAKRLDVKTNNTYIFAENPGNAIFSGRDSNICFRVSAANVTLDGLTLTHGTGAGGGAYFESDAKDGRIVNCIFRDINQTGTSNGGALYIVAPDLLVEKCQFINVTAKGSTGGGSIYVAADDVVITGCLFENNTALRDGGAIRVYKANNVKVLNSNFTNCIGSAGGAIAWNGENGNLTNCIFVDNAANSSYTTYSAANHTAGAVYWIGTYGVIDHCTFINNKAPLTSNTLGGGAILLGHDGKSANCTIMNSIFIGNSARNGGAIYWSTSIEGRILNCTFENNRAENGSGGALYWRGDKSHVLGSTFTDNYAKENGGAILINSNVANYLDLSECNFTNNAADSLNYTIHNGGLLFLDSNTIDSDYAIYNNRSIISPVIVYAVVNETDPLEHNVAVYLVNETADIIIYIVDDNINTINGPGLTLTIGDTEITEFEMDEYAYKASYKLTEWGTYNVVPSYDNAVDADIYSGTLVAGEGLHSASVEMVSEYADACYAGTNNVVEIIITNNGAFTTNYTVDFYVDGIKVDSNEVTLPVGFSNSLMVIDDIIRPVTEATVNGGENNKANYTVIVSDKDSGEFLTESSIYPTILYNGNLGKDLAYPAENITSFNNITFNGGIIIDTKDASTYLSAGSPGRTDIWLLELPEGASLINGFIYVSYNWDKTEGTIPEWTCTFNEEAIAPVASYRDQSNLGRYGKYGYGLVVYDVSSLIKNGNNTFSLGKIRDLTAVYPSTLVAIYNVTESDTVSTIYMYNGADLLANTNNTAGRFVGSNNVLNIDSLDNVAGSELIVFAASAQTGEGNLIVNDETYTNIWSGSANSVNQYVVDLGSSPSTSNAISFVATGSTIVALEQFIVVTVNVPSVSSKISSEYSGACFAGTNNVIQVNLTNDGAMETTCIVDLYVDGVKVDSAEIQLASGAKDTLYLVDELIRPVTADTVNGVSTTKVNYTVVVSDKESGDILAENTLLPTLWYNGNLGKDLAYPPENITSFNNVTVNGGIIIDTKDDSTYCNALSTGRTDVWTIDVPSDAQFVNGFVYVAYNWDKTQGTIPVWETTFNGQAISPVASYRDQSNMGTYGKYGYGLIVYDVSSLIKNGENTFVLSKITNLTAVYPSTLVALYNVSESDTLKTIYMYNGADLLSNANNFLGRIVASNNELGVDSIPNVISVNLYVFAASAQTGEGNLIVNDETYTNVWSGSANSVNQYVVDLGSSPKESNSVSFVATGSTIVALEQFVIVESVAPKSSSDLQTLIDEAEPGAIIDLGTDIYEGISNVNITKDVTITGGTIIGSDSSEPIFVIAPMSEDGPSEVNITGVNFLLNNANTIVKATADNATDDMAIDVAAINIKGNTIELANEDVVAESVTVLKLDSERPILSPTNEIAITGNVIAAGVDPFDFKVTSAVSGDDVNVGPQNLTPERKATVIEYSDMNTTAVSPLDPKTGEWFVWRLVDGDGNPIANTPMKIGFNGVIYDEKNGMVTDENGYAKLQINLGYKGDYTFAISFLGDDKYNASFVVAKIKVATQTGSLTVPNKSYAASAKTKSLTATFKTKSGKVVANKKISFTVNGKTYSAKTNDKGVATVNVSLNKKGTYSFTAKFAGDSTYTEMSKTAKLTIK